MAELTFNEVFRNNLYLLIYIYTLAVYERYNKLIIRY